MEQGQAQMRTAQPGKPGYCAAEWNLQLQGVQIKGRNLFGDDRVFCGVVFSPNNIHIYTHMYYIHIMFIPINYIIYIWNNDVII